MSGPPSLLLGYLQLSLGRRWAGAAGDFHLDRGRCETVSLSLLADRIDDGLGELDLYHLEVRFADNDFRLLAVGTGQPAGEIAVDDSDVVNEADFLQRS